VQQQLAARGIEYEIRSRLVRGLDYYTRTTFEVTHGALGAQNSILGGGRYDGLAEALGSRVPAPGIGFSIGEDRLVLALEEKLDPAQLERLDVFLIPVGEAALTEAARLARELRRAGLSVELPPDPRVKRAMELANKANARFAVILGEDEMARGEAAVKDMATGEQRALARSGLAEALAAARDQERRR
jgi:histidyl-tRNA synthetase